MCLKYCRRMKRNWKRHLSHLKLSMVLLFLDLPSRQIEPCSTPECGRDSFLASQPHLSHKGTKGWPNRAGRTVGSHTFISTAFSRAGTRRLTQCNTTGIAVTSIGFISSKAVGWLFRFDNLWRTAVNDEIIWHYWATWWQRRWSFLVRPVLLLFWQVQLLVNARPFVRQSTPTAASPWPCWTWMEISLIRMWATRKSKAGYMCDTLLKV